MGGQKRAPRRGPLWDGAHAVSSEDCRDGGSGDAMIEVLQRALDPTIAPGGILSGHPDNQQANLAEHARASDPPSLSRPFARDELPMPPQYRLRRHQGRHLAQDLSSQAVAIGGQSASLGIGQPEAPTIEMFFEDAVLVPQVLDASSWWRLTQPARATSKIRSCTASSMDRVYSHGCDLNRLARG
jgi:hypothetical protein